MYVAKKPDNGVKHTPYFRAFSLGDIGFAGQILGAFLVEFEAVAGKYGGAARALRRDLIVTKPA